MSGTEPRRRDVLVAVSSGCVALVGCSESESIEPIESTAAKAGAVTTVRNGYGTAYGAGYGTGAE